MLGFRGHFVTKSRGYSTTLGELRAARATYRAHQDEPQEADEDSTVVVAFWQYIGSGYLKASLRTAREALLDPRRGPP